MSMTFRNKEIILLLACAALLLTACGGGSTSDSSPRQLASTEASPDKSGSDAKEAEPQGDGFFHNESGVAQIFSTAGSIDFSNPFFKPFGNGRTCASCHVQAEGFSMTPKGLQERFRKTAGNDPVFLPHDGANSPNAPVGTLEEKQVAYSMMLNKGLVRIGMKIPDNAEFELVQADDPYHFASANELSLFRRPLPSANLKFLSNVMWDGRETALDSTSTNCLFGFLCFASLDANLGSQANGAITGHAQFAAGLTADEKRAIVDFEKTLYSAQVFDSRAKSLMAADAKGGPLELVNTDFYLGINDLFFGNVRTGAPFDPNVMQIYGAWDKWDGKSAGSATIQGRQAIARGEKIFNTKTFNLTGVGGINDDLGIPVVRNATCAACHNAPQAGTNSFPFPENIGVSDGSRRTPDMPLYTLRNKITGEILQTQDPGQAMITGLWRHIGRFKTTSLRGLASHPPYFHDGSAATLKDVVLFYDKRFNIGYTAQEIEDLSAFLSAL